MEHSEFKIGGTFWCSGRQWRCTDVGARTIVAIRIDSVEVEATRPRGTGRSATPKRKPRGGSTGRPTLSRRAYSTNSTWKAARRSRRGNASEPARPAQIARGPGARRRRRRARLDALP